MTKKPVRMTSDVKQFIVDQMAEGLDVSEIVAKYPDKVPSVATIYKQTITDDEFAVQVNQGYTVLLMHRMDELHRISSQTAAQAYPELEDWRQAEAVLKRRMDEAKFVLGRLAPILSTRFKTTTQLEVTGQINSQQLHIIDYSNAKIERPSIDITPKLTSIDTNTDN